MKYFAIISLAGWALLVTLLLGRNWPEPNSVKVGAPQFFRLDAPGDYRIDDADCEFTKRDGHPGLLCQRKREVAP